MKRWSPAYAFLVMGFMAPHLFGWTGHAQLAGMIFVAIFWGTGPVVRRWADVPAPGRGDRLTPLPPEGGR